MQQSLFWQLGALSDAALVAGLNRIVASGRRMLAELLAHLCEVENRRLHLDAGYPSMFAYCTERLGLSEDEAYRRIEVARLARRAPIIFALIAEGRLSLSAAALLRPHGLAPNLAELVEAVSGKSVQMAREALAARHPRPDVADQIRKLPERVQTTDSSPPRSLFDVPVTAPPSLELIEHAPPLTPTISAIAKTPPPHAPEPLSPGRYKVSFTASHALKDKLELARDLMRHSVPGGDIAAILERALDLLVADIMKSRFGSGARKKRSTQSKCRPRATPATEPTANATHAEPCSQPAPPATNPRSSPSETIPLSVRCAILERDGLRCTWRGPDGTRCTSRAWLERDHKDARSLGGATHLQNLRHLCRAHNCRAAEHLHGERHIERAIHRRRETQTPTAPRPAPSPPPQG
jgi:hypothetical protein